MYRQYRQGTGYMGIWNPVLKHVYEFVILG